ncbi:MAG: sensor histidine kinase [Bacteroidales bacterium]|nr:sensor histidine kinase [Bacteroidales bacterium]
MKDNLQFRVSAELKNILGKDLITSPDIAVLELVKNSYDAHATKVEITFDDDYLSIADNGKGMSKGDLINKWLFVAYSAKSDGTEDKSYRSKFKRHYAGAKGIGRMSCDRLARNLKLTTRSSEANKTEVLYVDWSVFEIDKQTEFDTINIPHETLDTIPKFPLNKETGTILEFDGLHVSWSRDDILRLKKSLEKMINPFSGTDDDFQIEIIASKMKEEDLATDSPHEKVNGVIENSIADVLKLKTTQIESRIENGVIYTSLTDRGVKMYEIEEPSQEFSLLKSVSISLFFLNRAAKYNFTAKMGVEPVNYGNVFLFRNGFRIFPFGESDDDSWGINKRLQQGYNRRLGTRDLFGRVDVETDDVNLIKEVSSRDGGLIKTEASQQLMDYFTLIHKRLERYVVGVLWGEGFLRKEYFVNQASAIDARKQLEGDKDSDSAEHLYSSIGSKVDFMQLIRSLANDNSINVKYYNEELADIVSNPSETEVIQAQMFDDVRKMAEKTNDSALLEKIADFELHMDELRRQKEDAERKAKEEEKKAEEARKKAQEEKEKREKAERERDAQIQKNKYLAVTRNTSKDVLDLIHTVLISSTNSISLIKTAKLQLADNDLAGLRESLDSFDYDINRIHLLSKMITKADLTLLAESQLIDIENYIKEYFSNYKPSCKIQYHSNITEVLEKKIPILDLSIVLENLVSNSEKAHATEFRIDFARDGRTYIVDFTDNGVGVDLDHFTPDSIFEEGVTNRRGGSGIGLSTIKERMKNELNGDIQFVGNGLHFDTGATFRLFFD